MTGGIEKHYSTRELAELLAVNPETVRRAVRLGRLRYVRVGRDFRFAASWVEEWLEGSSRPRGWAR
jgi:excisionase family DNA binding protein